MDNQPLMQPSNAPVQMVIMPNTGASGPEKSAVEIATDNARAAIQQNGTAITPEGQPRVPAGRPDGGEFRSPEVRELPSGNPPPAGPDGVTPEAPKVGPDGQPIPPVAPAAPEAPAPDTPVDELTVELPFTPEGATEPFAITAADPETAAALQTLSEEVVQGREAVALIDNARQQLARVEDMRDYSESDPVGFVVDMVGTDPERVDHLALSLLTSPSVFERLKPTLQKLVADPNEFRIVSSETRAKRAELRDAAQTSIAERREVSANLQEVQSTVSSLFPADMPEAQRRIAFTDCLRDLQAHANQHNLRTLPVSQIPELLKNRLTAYGIDPVAAAAAAATALARGGSRRTLPPVRVPAPPAPAASAAPAAPPAPARTAPNGQRFVASATARRAASIPGGGAGAPGSGDALAPPTNPDGTPMNIAQTLAWHRGRMAKGVKSY